MLLQLSLSDAKLKEFYESVVQDAKNMERKANVISLAVSVLTALTPQLLIIIASKPVSPLHCKLHMKVIPSLCEDNSHA